MANKLLHYGGTAVATGAGGPLAGAAWNIGYPIVEDWLTGGSDLDKAAEKQQAGMQAAAQRYEGYRPFAQSARQQGTQQQLSAYNGAANAMNLMYGTQYDPRNYAPNLGKNPWLTGDQGAAGAAGGNHGAPSMTKSQADSTYQGLAADDKMTPGKIVQNVIPGVGLTTAIAGNVDPNNKELFNTSGQSPDRQDFNAWMVAFRNANGGQWPSDAETAAWLDAHGRSAEAEFYKKRNRGRA